jgi:hypothetical protein
MRSKTSLLFAIIAAFAPAVMIWPASNDDAFDYPSLDFDHPAIQYTKAPSTDPVARLQQQMDAGEVKLDYDSEHYGYLPSVLKHLGLNTDSQLLVFSKTSFQGPRISPKKPRALYFNDSVAVGYVQGGDVMEVASLDPHQGVIFYTLDLQKKDKPSFFHRTTECMNCHVIPGTLDVPGLEVTSVIPGPDGSPRFPAGALIVDGRTPIEDRWGGWYVTGMSGGIPHRGNSIAKRSDNPSVLDTNSNQNVESLANRFDTEAYLAPSSDIVALMTLDHQTRMVNLMIRLGWETRIAEQEGKLQESHDRLSSVADQMVAYMLFANEAKLYDTLVGDSTFSQTFPLLGPSDKQGRSLRDFDLHKRLFKYPLSYMIYSETFDGMPDIAKQMVYQKIYDVLTGKNKSDRFANLSLTDRQAVLEIVRDTKPGLPSYWK